MKKIIAAAVVGTVALSSCSIFGTNKAAVSGKLSGFATDQNLQIAVLGYNNGQYVVDANQAQIIDKVVTNGFTVALPTKASVPFGTYRLIVFKDANSNGRYDAGDKILSKDNGKLLVFADKDGAYFSGTKYGWNIYDTATAKVQNNVLTGYDLDAAVAQ